MKEKLKPLKGVLPLLALTAIFLAAMLGRYGQDHKARSENEYFVGIERQEEEQAAQSAELVNINTAAAAELAELPGIGDELAWRIVEWRQENGFFSAKEELMQVEGIGESVYEGLQERITV